MPLGVSRNFSLASLRYGRLQRARSMSPLPCTRLNFYPHSTYHLKDEGHKFHKHAQLY